MSFTGQEDHRISLQDAAAMTKRYRDSNVNLKKGGFFGKDSIQAILDQQHCVGMRFYFAKDANGGLTIVLVGTDADENDLVNGELAEHAIPCPNQCGNNNELNSQ